VTFPKNNYILVVDDLLDNLTLIQFALESVGYQVETATNGEAALIQVKRNPPSLILLDVRMPGLDGLNVTKQLRQNKTLPTIPILLLTADLEVSETEALAIGADGILRKPLDFDQLLSRITSWCC
jgi:two-component system, sensor histidine kinase and response regulator